MADSIAKHYDAAYFDWQAPMGAFGPWANAPHFAAYVGPDKSVLDFGCGGGFMLSSLNCTKKVGVEINPSAAESARAKGIEIYRDAADVPDAYVDVVISNSALEHTARPFDELTKLHRVLAPGGTIVVIVPCEGLGYEFRAGDINQHLYSWSPMGIGNLLAAAGFAVVESRAYMHKWPPHHEQVAKLCSAEGFQLICRTWAYLERVALVRCFSGRARKQPWSQVRAVAKKAVEQSTPHASRFT